jgi:hypothetical protein
LFEAQPPRTIPYTPSELSAMMYRMPMGMSATTMSTTPQGVFSGAAKGITAKVTRAGATEIIGPSTKKSFEDLAGRVSSLRMFLSPSAMGCSSPNGPTRLGPMRSWIQAEIRRSARVVYATTRRPAIG